MENQKFQELYRQLNPEQKEAVETIEGPVMVMAGPGTGKTQVLTLRVANILLKTQVNPANILALTFTESGAAEMRQRLAKIIGRTAYQLNISTFHGFCNDLIRAYPEEFSAILGRKPANEVEQIELVKKVIDRGQFKHLKPFGETYFYLREARRMISQLKREGVSPEDFQKKMQEEKKAFAAVDDLHYDSGRYKGKMKGKYADWQKQIEKNLDLAKIYEGYQTVLATAKLYDFDDMILETARVLSANSDFLLRLQERYQYFLVDEHQDTNNAQNKVLELLSNFFSNPNLFVVGDEKQAIFRFQGASLENFLYFKKLYPQAKLVTLQKNYRSTQPILDLAHSFISHNQRKISAVLPGIKEELQSVSSHPAHPVEVYEFKREEAEKYFVAKKIAGLLEEGTVPQEIAVIYRDNRDALEVAEMLDKQGLPFRVESGENILADLAIGKLVTMLRFLHNPSEEKLFQILNIDFFKIPALDIYKLNSPGVRKTVSLLELISTEKRLKDLRLEASDKVKALADNLLRWQKLAKNETLLVLFETVVRESQFLNYLLTKKNSALAFGRLEALFREIKKLVANHPQTALSDFIGYLDNLERHEVGIRSAPPGYIPKAVRLMTAHGAKGLEFDHVFVTHCFDGHWGNRRIPRLIKLPNFIADTPGLGEEGGLPAVIDDERRLFYVAVTRARKMAYLSYAAQGLNQRAQLPSQFLEEIKPELKKAGVAEVYEKEFEKNRQILYQAPAWRGFPIHEKDYLNHLFYKRGLSATAINHYLECPWKYFYLSLLKIPRAKSKYQMYGTAVHAALKDFFNAHKRSAPTLQFLLEKFAEALQSEPLGKEEYTQALARGQAVLTAYHHYYQNNFAGQTLNEFRINGVVLEVGEGVRLTGSLDKIELLGGGEANVVDYKTGVPRSRNELEGKTKNATGDYKRQLVFYKLLLDSLPNSPAKMVSGEIDFVEPDKEGRFRKERFIVSPEEVKSLKEEVSAVAQQILNLEFWDNGCGQRECEFCRWRQNYAMV